MFARAGGIVMFAGDGGVVLRRDGAGGSTQVKVALQSSDDLAIATYVSLGVTEQDFTAAHIALPAGTRRADLILASDGVDRTLQRRFGVEATAQAYLSLDLANARSASSHLDRLCGWDVVEQDNLSVARISWPIDAKWRPAHPAPVAIPPPRRASDPPALTAASDVPVAQAGVVPPAAADGGAIAPTDPPVPRSPAGVGSYLLAAAAGAIVALLLVGGATAVSPDIRAVLRQRLAATDAVEVPREEPTIQLAPVLLKEGDALDIADLLMAQRVLLPGAVVRLEDADMRGEIRPDGASGRLIYTARNLGHLVPGETVRSIIGLRIDTPSKPPATRRIELEVRVTAPAAAPRSQLPVAGASPAALPPRKPPNAVAVDRHPPVMTHEPPGGQQHQAVVPSGAAAGAMSGAKNSASPGTGQPAAAAPGTVATTTATPGAGPATQGAGPATQGAGPATQGTGAATHGAGAATHEAGRAQPEPPAKSGAAAASVSSAPVGSQATPDTASAPATPVLPGMNVNQATGATTAGSPAPATGTHGADARAPASGSATTVPPPVAPQSNPSASNGGAGAGAPAHTEFRRSPASAEGRGGGECAKSAGPVRSKRCVAGKHAGFSHRAVQHARRRGNRRGSKPTRRHAELACLKRSGGGGRASRGGGRPCCQNGCGGRGSAGKPCETPGGPVSRERLCTLGA